MSNCVIGPVLNDEDWHFVADFDLITETVSDFTFWGSKITADVDCSHEF